ncbi:protoporphyrinogen oxidase [Opisthorchis viverrini]|uniref:Protoporphyrinogen oxidase n=2 Tax=Opisthorchis viverrini TaxID=6198 RepID=A0A1S8WJM6_OPIVI|nr:hypothetical protein T265_01565 [Opisthorchis viverrini]KER32338.1 hypothetical protein T265_01565 [Opisthorchis viverrini]OON14650.1 protoporphyrinogen oxidase [Opisthorchis viverrini]
MMANRLPHYCIVGGGIAGLSTAYFISLVRPPGSCRLTVLEAGNKFGGWIHSMKNPRTGAVYELGPHSARAVGPTSRLLLRLALSLDLHNSLLWMRSNEDAVRRFIYVGGNLAEISPFRLHKEKPFTRTHIGMFARRLLASRPPHKSDWSVDEFLRTRFDDEFADYLGSAMMRGIYAGDSRELSARACLPKLVETEENGPNLLLGMLLSAIRPSKSPSSSVTIPSQINSKLPEIGSILPPKTFAWSLHNGMQTITDSLAEKIRNLGPHVTLQANACVRGISHSGGKFSLQWSDEQNLHANLQDVDAIFLCCPSYRSAELLKELTSPEVISRLRKDKLPWANVAATVVELDRKSAQPPVRGFGHLVPRTEDPHILGIVYDSVAFPDLDSPDGSSVRYTVMLTPPSDWLSCGECIDDKIEKKALDALKEHLKFQNLEVLGLTSTLLRDCIPQYPLGHIDNIRAAREELRSSLCQQSFNSNAIHLVGSSYDGVGLGDVVFSALKAVCSELNLSV